MIIVTKEEKTAIKNKYPEAHIVRTMKQKSKRHRYFCEETNDVMKFLNQFRLERGVQVES